MDQTSPVFAHTHRPNWVRLRTLLLLRWSAVMGQIAAVVVAQRLFGLQLEVGWTYLVIGSLVASNLVSGFVYPQNRRLSEAELTALLLFDITQLGLLLFLTGGLNNPFALLILAPATIAAAALHLRGSLLVGAVAILIVTVVTRWHFPLVTREGAIMRMPTDFIFGFWIAIMIGIVFLSIYARRVTTEVTAMSDALAATQMALAREQKLTDLGGVVAAAAHELGTPLSTITLVSGELLDEIDDPLIREDVQLIREQADRCRVILRSMGRAGKDDLHLRRAPFGAVIEEAAEPHADRGKTLHYDIHPAEGAVAAQPVIPRRPEIIHGVRNLVQNAVDFAQSQVWIELQWSQSSLWLRITDDGPGFPPVMLPRLGDPFLRRRRESGTQSPRPGYEGMGLGLFIAKTLLERSGAELSFANGHDPFETGPVPERCGAVVEAIWPRSAFAPGEADAREPLGENQVFS
ncbi:sensor histidine kinase RegB [Profundibacterium mesophilum]|uniref:histidine kinase n=1 Tax=Profundibacterium mesophilum KAUST100406-0324 TaxID=1037889 RepID=A0A921NVK1_9RHOB|nr:ActS/PrrB/RegB family redox-sensitive histidine kinase [Profundibacterium mesophilum]KAF0676300.1 Sensor histidine kinase RegB [Profundibacterium mesophilum KAUST100406-0324]